MRSLILGLVAVFLIPAVANAQYTRREERRAQRVALQLLDKAKEQDLITAGERFRYGILLRFRKDVCCELLESIVPEAAAVEGLDASQYGTVVPEEAREGGLYKLDLDIEKLEQLLELLLKYLPQFIELIKELFL